MIANPCFGALLGAQKVFTKIYVNIILLKVTGILSVIVSSRGLNTF